MRLINNIKQCKAKYKDEIYQIAVKDRIIYYLISLAFTLFFLSGPIALIINLYLFVDYFYLVSFAACLIIFLGYNIFYLISYSIFRRKREFNFSLKYLIIENIILSFIISVLLYLFIIFFIKELVI